MQQDEQGETPELMQLKRQALLKTCIWTRTDTNATATVATQI